MSLPSALTITESDPSGGAGIQADLKTFTALNCYGTSVITALTAQNTNGMHGVHACPSGFVKDQLVSVLDDTGALVIKTGTLCSEATIRVVASTLRNYFREKTLRLVCDPVGVSTPGRAPLEDGALGSLIDEIMPLATLITPNKSEAELILSHKGKNIKISSLADMIPASKELLTLGSEAVLLKGGHVTTTITEVYELLGKNPTISVNKYGLLDENMNILGKDDQTSELVVDVLQDSSGSDGGVQTSLFVGPRVKSAHTHGVGCTLSAAIVCGLADRLTIADAVRGGTMYTYLGILHALPVGTGHSPLNHTHSLVSRFVPRPFPGDSYPLTRVLISSTANMWKEYVEHKFVKEVGKGQLDKKCFVHSIKQGYHYLKYYGRAYALMAAKSTSFTTMTAATQSVGDVLNFISTNHKELCIRWGVSEKELQETPESAATTAYGAYIMDIGFQGDTVKLTMALAPCLLGYGEAGLWLIEESKRPDSWVVMDETLNPYVSWIKEFSGETYQKEVKAGLTTIEGFGSTTPVTKERFEELVEVWKRCVVMEKGFWDMIISLS
ncbi:Phosphomethylpyrimidine kinase-domain-containing protein [Thelephora terrestris]|uniref:Phosphomethylpyrimidine kinase-domain-containing protein n=1 Tax=Thelephora terrestris TaxID=56493 RepID=A0A9P6HHH4_9AGAM|nr:Phosphomethylpyrimidine kinase-domain-containing protein [Thelephora terrestris]